MDFGPRKKRLIIAALVGLVLALLAIWFFRTVYDPFAESIDELLVFVPEEAALVLRIGDADEFVKNLPRRDFLARLDDNDALQRWLDGPGAERAKAVRRLRDAWRDFRSAATRDLPGGLNLIDDVMGRELVLWMNEAPDPDATAPPLFIAALKPPATSAMMALNVLADETLCDWFVADELAKEDIRVQHVNWGVVLDLPFADAPKGRLEIGLARIETAVLVGTDVSGIAKVANSIQDRGLDFVVPRRFRPGWAWSGAAGSSVELLFGDTASDRFFSLRRDVLEPAWGPDLAAAADRFIPELSGRDLYLGLDLDETLRLHLSRAVSERRPPDPISKSVPIDSSELERQLREVHESLPASVFGYAYLQASPATLIDFLLNENALISYEQRRLFYEELSLRLPRFARPQTAAGSAPDLTRDLVELMSQFFSSSVGVVLVNKGRNAETDYAEPGFALVFRVRDRAAIETFIGELESAFEQPFERFETASGIRWENTRKRWLDNPLESRPGLALRGDWFFITNWFPLFEQMDEVDARGRAGVSNAVRQTLRWNLSELEPTARGFIFVDPARLYDYMDDVKEGWVRERSEVSEAEKFRERQLLEAQAIAERVDPSSREEWVNRRYDVWLEGVRRERDQASIRRGIDVQLDAFRGAFQFLFLSLGGESPELRAALELAASDTR